jgi:hypothetical protein
MLEKMEIVQGRKPENAVAVPQQKRAASPKKGSGP